MGNETITIAGAGPAGLCAAINLAKAGRKVEVFEREKDVGTRWAGTFQCLENFSREEDILDSLSRMNIKPSFKHSPFRELTILGPGGSSTTLSSKKPLWHAIRRGNEEGMLDLSLKEQALEAGVKISFGSTCQSPDIISTGPSFPSGIAKEMAFETDLPDQFTLLLDNSCAPKGYSYLICSEGKATLCTAIMQDFQNLDSYFSLSSKKLKEKTGFSERNPKFKANFVSFSIPTSASKENSLYAGEAAGFQDFVFGFGLRHAFTSGYLCSQSLIQNQGYDSLWKKEILPHMDLSVLNRSLYEWGGDSSFKSLVSQAKAKGDLREFLLSYSTVSPLKSLLIPLAKILSGRAGSCNHRLECAWCPKKRR